MGVCGSILGRIQLPVTEGVGGSVGVFADHDGGGDLWRGIVKDVGFSGPYSEVISCLM